MGSVVVVVRDWIDILGPSIIIPCILFVVAICVKVKVRDALKSAIFAGIGLEGFNLLIGAYTPQVTSAIQNMVEKTGINKPVFDIGWSATLFVAYSSTIGIGFLILGLIFQLILFSTRYTNVFQPSDLVNNYAYAVWGSVVYFVTHNLFLSYGLMFLLNAWSLLISEAISPRWSKYYNYPNCTIVGLQSVEPTIAAIIFDPLWNLLKIHKTKISPENLQKRAGIIGEPMFLGFFVGLFIGIICYIKSFNGVENVSDILILAISTSFAMVIFPKIAELFGNAFIPISEKIKNQGNKSANKKRIWFLGINDAAGYGQTNTLVAGIILIPIMLIIAFILPTNTTLPVIDLVSIPYIIQGITALTNGNIIKIILNSIIYFTIGLYICSKTADLFSKIALDANPNLVKGIIGGAVLITSFNIMGKPITALMFWAFLSQNWILITITVVAYFALYIGFRTSRQKVWDYFEKMANNNLNIAN